MLSIKKELGLLIVLLIVSSIAIHIAEWSTMPVEHFKALASHPMPFHPLLYVFLIYILIALLRGIVALLKKLFVRQ